MVGRRIRLDFGYDIDGLLDRLGPVLRPQSEGAAGLGFSHQHAVQSNIDHLDSAGKILDKAGHAALVPILTLDVQGHRHLLPRFKRDLPGVRGHHHIRWRNNGGELQGLLLKHGIQVRRPRNVMAVDGRVAHNFHRTRRRVHGSIRRGREHYHRRILSRRDLRGTGGDAGRQTLSPQSRWGLHSLVADRPKPSRASFLPWGYWDSAGVAVS